MKRLFSTPKSARQEQRGFSLIEVLVTLMLVAFALLGIAGLQAYSMRVNKGGQLRTQAVFLAADLAERMEANKAGAIAGSYVLAQSSTAPAASTACTSGACSSDGLASYDLAEWQNMISAALPQSSWKVERTTVGNPSVYTITIGWVDRRTDVTYAAAGTSEIFSYTATRSILN